MRKNLLGLSATHEISGTRLRNAHQQAFGNWNSKSADEALQLIQQILSFLLLSGVPEDTNQQRLFHPIRLLSYIDHPYFLKNETTPFATTSTSPSVSSGKIGSARTSFAADSDTGHGFALICAKHFCRCNGIG